MIQIKINTTKCSGCRECHDHLPGLIDKAKDGTLLINLANDNISPLAILTSIDVCRLKALNVEAMQ